MSLFGTSPDDAPSVAASRSRNSLFDDEPSPAPGSKSSLFADDDGAPGWGMPTPKKAAKGELVKSLLQASDVPDSYIDIFDNMISEGNGSGGKITSAGVQKIIQKADIDRNTAVPRIMSVVYGDRPYSTDLTRNEFHVLLALIGLAEEHEDITLDGVDDRRRSQCFFPTETI